MPINLLRGLAGHRSTAANILSFLDKPVNRQTVTSAAKAVGKSSTKAASKVGSTIGKVLSTPAGKLASRVALPATLLYAAAKGTGTDEYDVDKNREIINQFKDRLSGVPGIGSIVKFGAGLTEREADDSNFTTLVKDIGSGIQAAGARAFNTFLPEASSAAAPKTDSELDNAIRYLFTNDPMDAGDKPSQANSIGYDVLSGINASASVPYQGQQQQDNAATGIPVQQTAPAIRQYIDEGTIGGVNYKVPAFTNVNDAGGTTVTATQSTPQQGGLPQQIENILNEVVGNRDLNAQVAALPLRPFDRQHNAMVLRARELEDFTQKVRAAQITGGYKLEEKELENQGGLDRETLAQAGAIRKQLLSSQGDLDKQILSGAQHPERIFKALSDAGVNQTVTSRLAGLVDSAALGKGQGLRLDYSKLESDPEYAKFRTAQLQNPDFQKRLKAITGGKDLRDPKARAEAQAYIQDYVGRLYLTTSLGEDFAKTGL